MNNPRSSPSTSPPSLLHSLTASYPSTSTRSRSPPRTPPRRHNRYPTTLTKDPSRVPLHRRGTSKTYERLEDLLKEAGYKETRVFTPETERQEQEEEERRRRERGKAKNREGSVRGGVGAVVGFLAGLVQGQGSGSERDSKALPSNSITDSEHEGSWSVPASPLAHKRQLALDPPATLRSSRLGGHSQFTTSPPSSATASGYASSASSSKLRPDPHRRLLAQEGRSVRSQPSLPNYAHPSPARAYLRHMASAPSIPKRNATPHHDTVAPPPRTLSLDDAEDRPPLPPSWFETVARALLGAPGAYPGGPVTVTSSSSSSSASRSNDSRGRPAISPQPPSRDSTIRGYGHYARRRPATALSDNTNKVRGRSTAGLLQPPALLLGTRAPTSPGLIVKTQVVCRSAPASRSSSRAGQRNLGDGSVRAKGRKAVKKGKGKRRDGDGGPSLSTRVEEDAWATHRHGAGLAEPDSAPSSSDEDGEIDLRKMLVPPKRQQSIASLRHHLERPIRSEQTPLPPRIVDVWLPEDDDDTLAEEHGRISRVRSRRGSMNEDDWAGMGRGTFDGWGSGRRRRGIPNTWTQWGAGTSRK